MSPSTLFLLVAFLLVTLVASAAVNDDQSNAIASALLNAVAGSTVVDTTPKASKMNHHSSNSTLNSTSNSTSTSASGYRKVATTSKRPAGPRPPTAAFTAGLASIVPVTAVLITLAMVGFRLYLNKLEDDYPQTREKYSEWTKPRRDLETAKDDMS